MATATASAPSLPLLLLAVLLLSASAAHGGEGRGPAVLKEKLSHLHFFFHDIISGPNATSVRIEDPKPEGAPKSLFRLVHVMDDLLTEGEDPASKPVAQGLYVGADLGELAFLQTMNLVFTDGKYSGSVLTVLGWNASLHEVREMPVVGGSGLFRFARGYAQARTRSLSRAGDAVVEVIHVEKPCHLHFFLHKVQSGFGCDFGENFNPMYARLQVANPKATLGTSKCKK